MDAGKTGFDFLRSPSGDWQHSTAAGLHTSRARSESCRDRLAPAVGRPVNSGILTTEVKHDKRLDAANLSRWGSRSLSKSIVGPSKAGWWLGLTVSGRRGVLWFIPVLVQTGCRRKRLDSRYRASDYIRTANREFNSPDGDWPGLFAEGFSPLQLERVNPNSSRVGQSLVATTGQLATGLSCFDGGTQPRGQMKYAH